MMQSSTRTHSIVKPRLQEEKKDDIDIEVYALGGQKKVFDSSVPETKHKKGISSFEKTQGDTEQQQNPEQTHHTFVENSRKDDAKPVMLKKSMLSTTRMTLLRAKHEHTIAGSYFRGRHNTFIFIPVEILSLILSTLGFFVSTNDPESDPTGLKSRRIGYTIGILGSLSAFIHAVDKHLNWDGRAAMHESCAISMQRILQDIRQAEYSDPNSCSLFDKSSSDTMLQITGREVKMIEKAEGDYDTALESCRSLIPSVISNAFSKLEVEFVMMVSPAGSGGSLLDDASSYMLLDYCFAELAIVLGDCLKAPSFVLPSAAWSVREAMASVKERLRRDAEEDLRNFFPYSESVQEFRKQHRVVPSFYRRTGSTWIQRMSTAFAGGSGAVAAAGPKPPLSRLTPRFVTELSDTIELDGPHTSESEEQV